MKRFYLTALAAALATGAFATVTSTNTFAQMTVTTNSEWTLLALPWVTPGSSDSQEIILTNLVLTTGLSTGDKLMHYNGTAYEMWTISDGKWTPAVSADETGIKQADDPASASFTRGIGVWLKRGGSSLSNPILLYGQVKTDTYDGTSVTVKSNETALVACPKATDLVLSEFTSGNVNDEIRYGDTVYSYMVPAGGSEKKWCKQDTDTKENPFDKKQTVTYTKWVETTSSDKIPAGFGFFYTSRALGGTTINW